MYEKKTNTLFADSFSGDIEKHWSCLSLYPGFIQTYSDNNETNVLKEHFDILLGIALELQKNREDFLKTGNLKDLFATAYYHTTFCKIEQILEGVYLYPIEKIKQITYFYQSYIWNRNHWENNNKNLVEKHWIYHFEKTEKKLPIFNLKKYIGHVLATGIEAHIDYDLARALQYAIKNRHLKNVEEQIYVEVMLEEFVKTETIFETVTDKTNADIEKAGLCSKAWLDFFSKSYGKLITKGFINPFTKEMVYTDDDVIKKRISALKKVFSQEKQTGMDGEFLLSQPITDITALERRGRTFLSNFFVKNNN